MHRRLQVSLLALGMLAGVPRTTLSAPAEGSLQVSLAAGYDSNPLELNPQEVIEPFGVSGGPYAKLNLDSRLTHNWTPRVGYFVSARGQGRLFSGDLEAADSSSARAEAGLGFVLFSRGATKLSASLSGAYGLARETFVDPATGAMYVTLLDPTTLAPIPDRFDTDSTSLNLGLRLRTSRSLLFILDAGIERQDYTEDYEEIPSLEPLDDRSMTLRPGVRWQISERVGLEVTAEWNSRRYDALSALEEDASLAAGTRRRYSTEGLRTVLRVTPSSNLSLQLGLGGADRQDLHAGYYDSIGFNAFAATAWEVTPDVRLGLHIFRSVTDYERATLDFTTNGETRGGALMRAAASLERDLGGHITFFGEAGAADSANADPLYDYRRNWAQAGVRFKR